MELVKILLLSAFMLTPQQLLAQAKPLGLGIIVANPTGFSEKHRISHRKSIDGALGYSFGNNDYLTIHATYLWEYNREIKIAKAYLGYYFGVGGSLHSHCHDNNDRHPHPWGSDNQDDDFGVAVRGSGGGELLF